MEEVLCKICVYVNKKRSAAAAAAAAGRDISCVSSRGGSRYLYLLGNK